MLLRHHMHSFSILGDGILSLQQALECPDGAGPGVCLREYRWSAERQRLELVRQRPFDLNHPGEAPVMQWDYEAISR